MFAFLFYITASREFICIVLVGPLGVYLVVLDVMSVL